MVVLRDRGTHALHVASRVHPLDDGNVSKRRLFPGEIMEALVFERMLDGPQPVGALGVAEARVVLEAGGMGKEQESWS